MKELGEYEPPRDSSTQADTTMKDVSTLTDKVSPFQNSFFSLILSIFLSISFSLISIYVYNYRFIYLSIFLFSSYSLSLSHTHKFTLDKRCVFNKESLQVNVSGPHAVEIENLTLSKEKDANNVKRSDSCDQYVYKTMEEAEESIESKTTLDDTGDRETHAVDTVKDANESTKGSLEEAAKDSEDSAGEDKSEDDSGVDTEEALETADSKAVDGNKQQELSKVSLCSVNVYQDCIIEIFQTDFITSVCIMRDREIIRERERDFSVW